MLRDRNRLATPAVGPLHAMLAALSTLLAASGGYADELDITDVPLFLSTAVKPNVIMAVDDSGSMDSEFLLDTNDGAIWWRTSAGGGCPEGLVGCGASATQDIPHAGRPNFNFRGDANAQWKKYTYLFPNGHGTGLRIDDDDPDDHFALPPLPSMAWTRSPEYNAAYFNPAEEYRPWQSYGSTFFGDASPAAARSDPVRGNGTFDLTSDRMSATSVSSGQACSGDTPALVPDHQFRMYPGMQIPAGTCFRADGGGNWQIAADNLTIAAHTSDDPATLRAMPTGPGLGVAIRYFPATFYLRQGTSLPAGYGWTGATQSGSGPDGEPLVGYQIKPGNFSSLQAYQAAIQNFANWWTYYRKRHLATRGGLGFAFKDIDNTRVGTFTINNRVDVTMRDLDIVADRDTFYSTVYNYVNSGPTPNREAVHHMGGQLNRTGPGAPITHACQRNFGVLFTDGYSAATVPDPVGNVDGSMGSPFADNVSNTMGDYAANSYLNRLRSDLPAGKVPVPAGCSVSNPDPRLDCADDLHMNFFAVTLGAKGLIYNVDAPATSDPFANPPTWPTSFPARHPSAVDDLWHATINARGSMLNARTPKEVGEKLGSVLRTISQRIGSSSAAAVNAGSISSDTRVYQARFNSSDWTGQLLSIEVRNDGTLSSTPQWDAATVLPAAASRHIITYNRDTEEGVAFRWAEIGSTAQSQLEPAADGLGAQRLEFLRGDELNEQQNGGFFRDRATKLGDIVSSAPVFVAGPAFFYPDGLESQSYAAFKAARANRRKIVYVGANDGMLHAFDAVSGVERLAFVPSGVFANLHELTSPDYSHRYFVDGTPTIGDVFYGGAWRTVLVGGANKGGQSIYALNITDPANFDESNAESLVLWEYSDNDLGYTYSRPAIVRLSNGKWAAVFGNGYNNTTPDGTASSTGRAYLYVVDIEDGSLIRKIDTGAGSLDTPNGLATPAVVDLNGDAVADLAYAGDLRGNLWKFDFSDTDPAAWDVAYFSGSAPRPLFRAQDAAGNPQPITVRPEVGRGPNGLGVIVLFGTGKYLELADKDPEPTRVQSFYGIIDRHLGAGDIVSSRTLLRQQEVLGEDFVDFEGDATPVRVTSDHELGSARGWYLDLLSGSPGAPPPSGYKGEKQVSDPILRNGRVIFTTVIPNSDPCGFGGDSWLMEMDVLSGARLDLTPFDLNRDGRFDSEDYVQMQLPDGSTATVPVSGLKSEVGMTPRPGIIAGEKAEYKYTPGTSGGIQVTVENPGVNARGRQSWRQIR